MIPSRTWQDELAIIVTALGLKVDFDLHSLGGSGDAGQPCTLADRSRIDSFRKGMSVGVDPAIEHGSVIQTETLR